MANNKTDAPTPQLAPGTPANWSASFAALAATQTAGQVAVMTSRQDVPTAPPPAYTSTAWKAGGFGMVGKTAPDQQEQE
jgi:hypothetical protein